MNPVGLSCRSALIFGRRSSTALPPTFMVPRRARFLGWAALHEPSLPRNADFPVGALAGWKTGDTEAPRFMVPMHAKNRKAALHEPPRSEGGAPRRPDLSSSSIVLDFFIPIFEDEGRRMKDEDERE